jgi:hypothetical protein
MAKDAGGHGSEGRGGNFAATRTPDKSMFGRKPTAAEREQNHQSVKRFTDIVRGLNPHQQSIADQHGIPTQHLNSQGNAWGSPAALSDFKTAHGGPRDHVAEQRGFNSGAREINRMRRQGK